MHQIADPIPSNNKLLVALYISYQSVQKWEYHPKESPFSLTHCSNKSPNFTSSAGILLAITINEMFKLNTTALLQSTGYKCMGLNGKFLTSHAYISVFLVLILLMTLLFHSHNTFSNADNPHKQPLQDLD